MRAHIGSHAKPLRFPPLVNVTVLGTQNYRELLFPLLYLLSSSDISTGNNIAENIPQEPAQNAQPMQNTGAQPQGGTTDPSAIPGQAAEAFNDAAKKRKMRTIIFIIIAIILAAIMLIPQILEINSL